MISVEDAVKHFPLARRGLRRREHVRSVDGVSAHVAPGEVLGLVGESGSGKSTLARIILGLVRPTSGRVRVDGLDTTCLTGPGRRQLARTAQLVFQDPHAAMDPRMTLGESLTAVLAQHRIGTREERAATVSSALEEVGLDGTYLDKVPGECSGGQLQRAVIARALLLAPKVLICDEPTSALDASVQARILNLLRRLRREHQLTMVMISHDLRVVRVMAERVAVMYLGQIVETAARDDLFTGARHPYTLALLDAATPRRVTGEPDTGAVEPPSPINPPAGCRFHPRCPLAADQCRTVMPPLVEIEPGHEVRCHRWREVPVSVQV
ncbi:ABC transporter ATP-binding protein [Actinophytocola sp.]|uniref:ABC transporter ATP-binding protein n=1 Tax=Actinophytocola sp. TaxID=1872138 RepID=UPI002ED409BC